MMYVNAIVCLLLVSLGLFIYFKNKKRSAGATHASSFPQGWRDILNKRVLFYTELPKEDQAVFEKRTQHFIGSKNIEGIDIDIDDTTKLLVAASAIIPTFAFEGYSYPNVRTILIYPNSFEEQFQTTRYEGHTEFISGMVGNRFMNGTVILSKPDLEKGFDGAHHNQNVGIHEFVHLLDKEDGAIDGIPELLLQHRYVGGWLKEIKDEMQRIRKGNSDINPYALTNNAEFLAVVSEYFFSNSETFHHKHPELYKFLSTIYDQPATEELT